MIDRYGRTIHYVSASWLAGWTSAFLRHEAVRRDNASWAARLRRLADPTPLPGEPT